MANFVLVHGSAHGSWCWQRVVPLLQEMGHKVVAVDLPGNGHDDALLSEVTLETYAEHLCGVLDAQDGPSVLVGHSLGGISISRAAEMRPDRVAVLVYLTALLLQTARRSRRQRRANQQMCGRRWRRATAGTSRMICPRLNTSRSWHPSASTTIAPRRT